MVKRIQRICLVCILLISVCMFPSCSVKHRSYSSYPYVFVHGPGGWQGSDDSGTPLPYWGSSTENLIAYLNNLGFSSYEAVTGPLSSVWDQTCELYAQLTGTTVDYGEAHAAAHNHARYGRKYENPLFKGWGSGKNKKLLKVNLVGHSYGGLTVRLLTHLLENGADEETKNCSDPSPLFTGGKGNWVNSVTTLCTPHNGSTLRYALSNYRFVDLLRDITFSIAGYRDNIPEKGFIDFHLEQFGLKADDFTGTSAQQFQTLTDTFIQSGTDHIFYDLSPEGAKALNDQIEPVGSVYYFSYTFTTTRDSTVSNIQLPLGSTSAVFQMPSLLMGKYDTNTKTDYKIDNTWLENDGFVNVISAKHPLDEPYQAYDDKTQTPAGIWNVMPVSEGDHASVIGMNTSKETLHSFYSGMISVIEKK